MPGKPGGPGKPSVPKNDLSYYFQFNTTWKTRISGFTLLPWNSWQPRQSISSSRSRGTRKSRLTFNAFFSLKMKPFN